MINHKLLLYGAHFMMCAFALFMFNVGMFILSLGSLDRQFVSTVSLSYALFLVGSLFVVLDLFLSFLKPKVHKSLMFSEVEDLKISIGMTAWNDAPSIGVAVKDFIQQDNVAHLVVVDNNSKDETFKIAQEAGAKVVVETVPGYGSCCMRALREAMKHGNLICLVEGDGTFSGSDLKKFVAYMENADMVIGTRTTKELNTPDSQVNFLIQYGNIFMAKLLQIRFWNVRLTDVGCTVRMIRKEALERILDKLRVSGNHFSCEMIMAALQNGLMVIEIPVSLKKRIGLSKGVGGNIYRAALAAFHMWWMILFGNSE